jgi:glutamate/tyrosine decarboxylase-like PLP-dependent enzyme
MYFYDQALYTAEGLERARRWPVDATPHLPCVVPNREFLRWNAQEQLAQATWEWPSYVNYASADGYHPSLKRPGEALWRAIERETKAADRDWEQRGKHEFKRQLYGN